MAPVARAPAGFRARSDPRASEPKSGVRDKPTRSALECMRHDARSAAHALSGFLDLLQLDALGPLTDEQRRAIKHMEAAAERMSEIAESALELAEVKRPLRPSEASRTCLIHVAQHVLYGVSRALPATNITFACEDGVRELHVEMQHERLNKLLSILMDVVRSTAPSLIDVRISRTDLHASLVVAARSEEASSLHSMPAKKAASTDLDAMASAWSNREYVRLKRLEALLTRYKGRLLVAPDLTRMRMMLPLAR
jgi:signal transduction histidine kinase